MSSITKTIDGINQVSVGSCPVIPCTEPVFTGVANGQIKVTNNTIFNLILLESDNTACQFPRINCLVVTVLLPGQNFLYTFLPTKSLYVTEASCNCACSGSGVGVFNIEVNSCDTFSGYTQNNINGVMQFCAPWPHPVNSKIHLICS